MCEIVESFYTNMNIYYALVLAGTSDAASAARYFHVFDYPVVHVKKIEEIELFEQRYRMFVMNADMLNELIFVKGSIEQYSVIFCLDDEAFKKVGRILSEKKPRCIENVYVTKISIDII